MEGMAKRMFSSYLGVVLGSLFLGAIGSIIVILGGYMNIVHCPPQNTPCTIINVLMITFFIAIPFIVIGGVVILVKSKNVMAKLKVTGIGEFNFGYERGKLSIRIDNNSDDYLDNLVIYPIRITAIGTAYLKDLPTEEHPFLTDVDKISSSAVECFFSV